MITIIKLLFLLVACMTVPIWLIAVVRAYRGRVLPKYVIIATQLHYISYSFFVLYSWYVLSHVDPGYMGLVGLFAAVFETFTLVTVGFLNYGFMLLWAKFLIGGKKWQVFSLRIVPVLVFSFVYILAVGIHLTGTFNFSTLTFSFIKLKPDTEIHGVIYDQNMDPVVNVAVEYSLRGGKYQQNWRAAKSTTDEEGHFTLLIPSGEQWNDWIKPKSTNYEFVRSEWGQKLEKKYTKANPGIFHAWKKSNTPDLVSGDLSLPLRKQKYYYLDLSKPRIGRRGVVNQWEKNQRAEAWAADLRIRIKKVGGVSRETHRSWEIEIDAMNGGIVESHDLFMHLAPESGYKHWWSEKYKKESGKGKRNSGWKEEVRKKFYVMSRDGKLYSRVELRVSPFYGREDPVLSLIDIKYWTNTTGSRNLQIPDPFE